MVPHSILNLLKLYRDTVLNSTLTIEKILYKEVAIKIPIIHNVYFDLNISYIDFNQWIN